MDETPAERVPDMPDKSPRLSYKFQRLRERLREAIETGVLSGKLPGERVLARQFRVNAKTLSKALTDLAAEGLLDRTIGRGTYVKGHVPEEAQTVGRWLLLVDPEQTHDPLVAVLQKLNPESDVASDVSGLRPSYLAGFSAVIDLHGFIPDSLLRDLMLRSLKVVLVDHLPEAYSTHAVLIDRQLSAGRLTQAMLREGHSRIGVVDADPNGELLKAVQNLLQRLAPDAKAQLVRPEDVVGAVDAGVSALICSSFRAGSEAVSALRRNGIEVPGRVSVAAMGVESPHALRVSGYAVTVDQLGDAVRTLLREANSHRPVPLWLAGVYVEHGTIAAYKPSTGALNALGARGH